MTKCQYYFISRKCFKKGRNGNPDVCWMLNNRKMRRMNLRAINCFRLLTSNGPPPIPLLNNYFQSWPGVLREGPGLTSPTFLCLKGIIIPFHQ
jgi:hypothetical protein